MHIRDALRFLTIVKLESKRERRSRRRREEEREVIARLVVKPRLVPRGERTKKKGKKGETEEERPFGRTAFTGGLENKNMQVSRVLHIYLSHACFRHFLLPMSSRRSKGDTGIRRAQRMPTLCWRVRLLVSHAANLRHCTSHCLVTVLD